VKRVLPVVLVLSILFPVLLLPAVAVEPEEYVFEPYEMPSLYSDHPFLPDDDLGTFAYFGHLPDGRYTMELDVNDTYLYEYGLNYSISGVFDLTFDYISDEDIPSLIVPIVLEVTDLDSGITNSYSFNILFEIYGYNSSDFTITAFYVVSGDNTDAVVDLSFLDQVVLVSYDLGNDLNPFLTTLVSGLVDLSVGNIVQVILVALGVVSAPVLCWFGYRFVKRKLLKSFKKGKI